MLDSTQQTHQFIIGSSNGCDLELRHPSISRAHAKVYFSGENVLLEDLNSTNGTFVLYEGEFKRVKSAKIKLNTIVRFGDQLLEVEVKDLISNFQNIKIKQKNDISNKVKSKGLKRCSDCGNVLSKTKVHCDCCGAIFEF